MAARRGTVEVDLVEDEPVGDEPAAPPVAARSGVRLLGTTRRRVLGAVVVVAVAAAALVVADRLEDAADGGRLGAVLASPVRAVPYPGPPTTAWVLAGAGAATSLGARIDGDVLVRPTVADDGGYALTGHDLATGSTLWTKEVETPGPVTQWSGWWTEQGPVCRPAGASGAAENATCLSVVTTRDGLRALLHTVGPDGAQADGLRAAVPDAELDLTAGALSTLLEDGTFVSLVTRSESAQADADVTPEDAGPTAPTVTFRSPDGAAAFVTTLPPVEGQALLEPLGTAAGVLTPSHGWVVGRDARVLVEADGPTPTTLGARALVLHAQDGLTVTTTVVVDEVGTTSEVMPWSAAQDDGSAPGLVPVVAPGTWSGLDRDGTPVWSREVPAAGVTVPYLLDAGMLVGVAGGEVVAVDAGSGADLWTTEVPAVELLASDGERLLVRTNGDGLCALDLDDGTVVWATGLEDAVPGGTAVRVLDGLLVATVGEDLHVLR